MKSPYLHASVAGLMIGTSYIPFPPWAIFFGFVPLWISWMRARSVREVFLLGWTTQITLTLIGFNWVAHTVHEFGHLPWIASVVILFGFAAISTLSIPLAGVAWWYWGRVFRMGQHARTWTLPIFLAAFERLVPMIFDWHLGYTWLWAGLPGYHLADLIGFAGLSSLGLVVNGAVLNLFLRARKGESWVGPAVSLASGLVVFNIVGWWHGRDLDSADAITRVQIVQANIENEEKLAAETGSAFRDVVLDRFAVLTRQGIGDRPDFIVWPETAFPDSIVDASLSGVYPAKLRALANEFGATLITGGYGRNPQTLLPSNAFFAVGKTGTLVAAPYAKTMLLAFGEYFPGADLFPRLREWFPEVGHFERGPGPTVLTLGDVRVGAQICYEGLFDWFSRGLAAGGAEILVNLTNDSWYGTWEEPYQHLYMTLARAVETRRPLVRSTNTGISTVILASGERLAPSPMHEPWQKTFEVAYRRAPPLTVFTRWGFAIVPLLLGFSLAFLTARGRAPTARA